MSERHYSDKMVGISFNFFGFSKRTDFSDRRYQVKFELPHEDCAEILALVLEKVHNENHKTWHLSDGTECQEIGGKDE